jgi:excisionase family DNA binding protein
LAPRLLTVKEVALRLGLTRSAVYAMVKNGRLPALTLGEGKRPRIRVDERELEAWLYGEPS